MINISNEPCQRDTGMSNTQQSPFKEKERTTVGEKKKSDIFPNLCLSVAIKQ